MQSTTTQKFCIFNFITLRSIHDRLRHGIFM